MLTFLRKLFIPNYQQLNDEKVRTAHGVFASVFGIVTNLIIVVLKLFAAFYIASKGNWVFPVALVADAINNLGDLSSSLVSLIGFKLSQKPADKEHPFGHQRIEYVAGLIVAIFIVVAGLEMIKSSIESIVSFYQDGVASSYDFIAIIFLGISILLKGILAYVNFALAKLMDSVALKNVGIDSLLDVISGTSVLLCAIFSLYGHWDFLDGYFGLVISLLLLYNGIESVKDSASPLIGEANKMENIEKIRHLVLEQGQIYGVHDILYHSYGPNNNYISLHIEIDEGLSLKDSHKIADEVEKKIKEEFKAEVTVHVDPSQRKNPQVHKAYHQVIGILANYSKKITIHDFQIEDNVLSFEILLPYGIEINKAKLEEEIKATFSTYEVKINFEHPFAE